MKTKKVLFTSHTANFSKFNRPFMRWFSEQGYTVHYVSAGEEQVLDCDKHFTIPFERNPLKINNITAYKKLKKIIDTENYDIIHTHTPVGGVITRLAARDARKKGTRVIYTAHGFHFFRGAPIINWLTYYPIEKYMAKFTDTLITINNEDYEIAKSKFKTDVQYVPGVGIDPKKFDFKMSQAQKTKLRHSLGLNDDDFVMIYPAELNKNKNQLWLIKSIADLIKNNSKIHLLLPGIDSLNGKCQKLAMKLGIDKNIHFLEYRNDIPQLLKISDLSVSSSLREGLPVNIMEAMYVGLPVLSTSCRGAAELIKNNINGYIHGSTDAALYAKSLIKITKNEKLRNKLGNNSKLMSEKYSLNNVKEDMNNIYKNTKENYNIHNKSQSILHILSSNRFSGAENVAVGLISSGGGVYCSPYGSIEKTLKDRGIKYVGIKKLTINYLNSVVKDLNPDVIYAHDFRASLIMGYFFGKKHSVVSYIHQNPEWLDRVNIKTLLYKKVINNFKKIIVVSDAIVERKLFKDYGSDKVIIQYNKVNEEIIHKLANEKIKQNYDICFIGRLQDVKQPEHFIDMIAEIKKHKSDIKAVIVGDGDLFKQVKDKVSKMNVSKNIDIVGFQKNPYKYINASKALAITSKNEGLPMVLLEAISLGKCVLFYKYPTLCRIFSNTNNDNNGTCENINDMSQKALTIINDTNKHKQMAKFQSIAIDSLYNPRDLK